MNTQKTSDEVAKDLHKLFSSYLLENLIPDSWILSWLCITLVGTMEMKGYSRERFQTTLDKMMSEFDKKRENNAERLS